MRDKPILCNQMLTHKVVAREAQGQYAAYVRYPHHTSEFPRVCCLRDPKSGAVMN